MDAWRAGGRRVVPTPIGGTTGTDPRRCHRRVESDATVAIGRRASGPWTRPAFSRAFRLAIRDRGSGDGPTSRRYLRVNFLVLRLRSRSRGACREQLPSNGSVLTGPNNESAGIGFSYEGDGLRLLVSVPDDSSARAHCLEMSSQRVGPPTSTDGSERGVGFPDHVSVFQRHWLRVALLIALLRAREPGEAGLRPAIDRLALGGLGAAMETACDALCAAIDPNTDAEDGDGDPPAVRRGQLHAGLVALRHDDDVMRAVAELAADPARGS